MAEPDLELVGFEWDVRRRTAEAIARGDAPATRDLEWLAEGYLHLLNLVDEADSRISELERDLEEAQGEAGDNTLLTWRCNGKEADRLLHVPITYEIYNELVEASNQIDALDTKDSDTSAAVVAFASLSSWADLRIAARNLRDAAQVVADHSPPNRRRR